MERSAFFALSLALFAVPASATPSAARITAAIAADDTATITGTAGAVAPQAYVLCVSLETAYYAFTRASAEGAFQASLFAPAGTTILVKEDAAVSSSSPTSRLSVRSNNTRTS